MNWLWKEWANVLRVRNDGIPIVGFTWYSLTDQVDWDTRASRGERQRQSRWASTTSTATSARVGKAYKQLIHDWCDVLPTQSVCLVVPIATPVRARRALDRAVPAQTAILDGHPSAQPSNVRERPE